MTDTIADLINRINNARNAGQSATIAPFSKMKAAILEVLKTEGYITDYKHIEEEKILSIELDGSTKKLNKINRISKPGRRVYVKASNIPRPKSGYGSVVISTPVGVISGMKARRTGIGGEIICEVY